MCFYFPHNSNRKKLWHFESRIGVRSSLIFDDFIYLKLVRALDFMMGLGYPKIHS